MINYCNYRDVLQIGRGWKILKLWKPFKIVWLRPLNCRSVVITQQRRICLELQSWNFRSLGHWGFNMMRFWSGIALSGTEWGYLPYSQRSMTSANMKKTCDNTFNSGRFYQFLFYTVFCVICVFPMKGS